MYSNIFQIWRANKKKVPFVIRKMSWSDPDVYAIVEKVVPDQKGYGKAYGYPVTNGEPNDYFEYSNEWRSRKQIPVAGCFVWEEVTDIVIEEGKFKRVIAEQSNNKAKNNKKTRNKMQGIYEFQTTLSFGKYKGYTVKEILEDNPKYLLWAINNIEGFIVAEDVKEALER